MDLTKLEALLSKIATIHPELATEIEALSITTTPAPKASFASPKGDAWSGPMPPISSVSFRQTTVWDNGAETKFNAKGNKTKQQQFTATIEAYTLPLDSLLNVGLVGTYRFKRNVQLRPASKFLDLVKKNNQSKRITDEFRYYLDTYVSHPDVDQAKDRFGFILDSGTWDYHQGQFVHLAWTRTGEPELRVIQEDDFVVITSWDRADEAGKTKWTNEGDMCGYRAAKASSSSSSRCPRPTR